MQASRRATGAWCTAAVLTGMAACGVVPTTPPPATGTPSTTSAATTATPTPPVTPSATTPGPTVTEAGPSTPSVTRTATASSQAPVEDPPSLTGHHRNAWAFAPLDDPAKVTVEGSVPVSEAWSTSKVLVVAAFLDVVAGGDPERVSGANRRLITKALTASDGDAVLALQRQVPRVGRAMTRVLRDVGDRTTVAPDRSAGLMRWSVREQVRFMAALANGQVVSGMASRYLLDQMHPIKAHAWGLGRIGATAYKGGWLRQGRVTRQMGIVDGYAVAIITDAVGPVELQTDGDSAHVRQLNRLAARLKVRLASEHAK